MSAQNITCIVCPRGCALEVDAESGTVAGNSCKRGVDYGIAEATNPVRTLTTTVRVVDQNGDYLGVVPVRTSGPAPKGCMFDAMKVINAVRATKPIKRGDVLVPNILNTGVDVVATREFF